MFWFANFNLYSRRLFAHREAIATAGYTIIKPLHIYENGVFMLLDRIDVSKSSGPDKLPGRLLQSLAKEITPVVHFIFAQSLCTSELPTEWTQANVAPIFKERQ